MNLALWESVYQPIVDSTTARTRSSLNGPSAPVVFVADSTDVIIR